MGLTISKTRKSKCCNFNFLICDNLANSIISLNLPVKTGSWEYVAPEARMTSTRTTNARTTNAIQNVSKKAKTEKMDVLTTQATKAKSASTNMKITAKQVTTHLTITKDIYTSQSTTKGYHPTKPTTRAADVSGNKTTAAAVVTLIPKTTIVDSSKISSKTIDFQKYLAMVSNIPTPKDSATKDNSSNQTTKKTGPTTEASSMREAPTTVTMLARDATNTVVYISEERTTATSKVTENASGNLNGSTELDPKTEAGMTNSNTFHALIGCCCNCCLEDTCHICSNGSLESSVHCASRMHPTDKPQDAVPPSSSTPHFSAPPVLMDSMYNRPALNSDFLKGETLIETIATIPEEVKIKMGHNLKDFVLSCKYSGKDCYNRSVT